MKYKVQNIGFSLFFFVLIIYLFLYIIHLTIPFQKHLTINSLKIFSGNLLHKMDIKQLQ